MSADRLTLEDLLTHCAAGGGSALQVTTELAPAGGFGAVISPARVVERNEATYAFERRLHADPESAAMEAAWHVVVDSKQSVSNRDEVAVVRARQDETSETGAALRLVPTIQVSYSDITLSDLELPHRFADAHVRAGSRDGEPVTKDTEYVAARNASANNARALFETAPTSLLYGAWDSTRKARQGRYPTCLTGEVIGMVADQDRDPRTAMNRRAGARVDPVAASVRPDEKTVKALVEDQKDELSPKLQDKILTEAKKNGAKGSSMSTLGFGNVPPSLEGLGGIACTFITRRRVLSFAALRQLRFGGSVEADVACRSLLAAYGLLAMTLSDQELYLRANCELVEKDAPQLSIDLRHGQSKGLKPLDEEAAVALFRQALEHAQKVAGVRWEGQVLEVQGNESIRGAASADEPEE